MLWPCVCPSVRLSLCATQAGVLSKRLSISSHANNVVSYRRMLVFWCQRTWWNYSEVTSVGGAKRMRSIDKKSSGDEFANVNFYAVRPEATRIRWNNAKITAITPFKVIQDHRFWYQSKAYDFLSVITNLPPILHRFRDRAVDRSEIAILGYPSCV